MRFVFDRIVYRQWDRIHHRQQCVYINIPDSHQWILQTEPGSQWFAHRHAYEITHMLPHGWGGRHERGIRLYRGRQLRGIYIWFLVIWQLFIYRVDKQWRSAQLFMSQWFVSEWDIMPQLYIGVVYRQRDRHRHGQQWVHGDQSDCDSQHQQRFVQAKSNAQWIAQLVPCEIADMLPHGWGGRHEWCVGLYWVGQLWRLHVW